MAKEIRFREEARKSMLDGVNVLALVTAPRNVKAAPGVHSRQVGGSFVWLVGNLPQDALAAADSEPRIAHDRPR